MKDRALKPKKGRVKAQVKAVRANKAANNPFELAPAVRRHASDERVAMACCALLSAFHDVFDREPTPPPFRRALADAGTLAALEEVLEQHEQNPTIGFATKWALKVGQEAAAASADPQRAEERLAAKENSGGDQQNRARARRGRQKGVGAA